MEGEPSTGGESPPAEPRRQPRPRRWLRARSNPLLVFSIAFFVTAAFYAGLVLVSRADTFLLPGRRIPLNLPIPLPGIEGGEGASRYGERLNILVLGLDRNLGDPEDQPARSDTIFVLTVDMLNEKAAILSFPRDLVVEVPDGRGGFLRERINIAFPLGMLQGGTKGGTKRAIATVERNFGIDIHRYVVVDFLGFMELIDLLGGIDITVPKELRDPKYILPGRKVVAHFTPGPTHMDSEMALAYSRIRVDSDLDRIQRQQQVIWAAMAKVMSLQLLTKAIPLWREYRRTVDTDLPDWEVPGLSLLALRIGPERLKAYSLGEAVQPAVGPGGASILLPVREKVQALFKRVFYDPRLHREGATVQILDGSGDGQRAARLSAYLAAQGLPEASIVNGDASPPLAGQETTIYNLTGKRHTAKALAQWLGLPEGRVRARNAALAEALPTGVDILLMLGPDARIP